MSWNMFESWQSRTIKGTKTGEKLDRKNYMVGAAWSRWHYQHAQPLQSNYLNPAESQWGYVSEQIQARDHFPQTKQ